MLKRGDKVHAQIVKNCSMCELTPVIKGHADPSAVVCTDGFKVCDGLVNYGYKKHFRVKYGHNQLADGTNHINGMENFRRLCKVRLAKFRGVRKHTFYSHIKE
jgi:transposase-like protein